MSEYVYEVWEMPKSVFIKVGQKMKRRVDHAVVRHDNSKQIVACNGVIMGVFPDEHLAYDYRRMLTERQESADE